MKKLREKEKHLQIYAETYLEYKKLYYAHLPNVITRMVGKKFVSFSVSHNKQFPHRNNGIPDLIIFGTQNRLLLMELKPVEYQAKARQGLSEDQERFQAYCKAQGYIYVLCFTREEIKNQIDSVC